MKFWVKFSKTLFKFAALPWLKKAQSKSIEAVLKKSIDMLEPEMLSELHEFIHSKQTLQGGFADRAGKCDLYYSLFGYYIAEALSVTDVINPFKNYIKKTVTETTLSRVHLYCGAILYAKVWGIDATSEAIRIQVAASLKEKGNHQSEYTNFLGILALYYLEDFHGIWRILKQYKSFQFPKELPCPVIAATTILLEIAGKSDSFAEDKLKSFYRRNGGFTALSLAPAEDILSTSVALYALNFINADIRLIKPDCLSFIDNLYFNGGFRSMQQDVETDVEYTFYGLLALGALNN